MSIEFWLAYTVTVFVASIIPGPSMLLALTHGIRFGTRRALASAFGNTAASLLQACFAIAGLGVVMTASQSVFLAIKYIGAAYLVYLGISLWRSPEMVVDPRGEPGDTVTPVKGHRLFSQAFMVAAGNPKAIVFFTALFPQFIDPDHGGFIQYGLMIGTLAVIAFSCMMLYAAGGQRLAHMICASRFGRWFHRALGGCFVGAGIGLAVSRPS